MSAHIRAGRTAHETAVAKRFSRVFTWSVALLSWSPLAAGCIGAPTSPWVGPDPSDPRAAVPPDGYRSTTGPYTRQRPVSPAPWLEQNERAAPAPMKIRAGLAPNDYKDPGPYRHPDGTVAYMRSRVPESRHRSKNGSGSTRTKPAAHQEH